MVGKDVNKWHRKNKNALQCSIKNSFLAFLSRKIILRPVIGLLCTGASLVPRSEHGLTYRPLSSEAQSPAGEHLLASHLRDSAGDPKCIGLKKKKKNGLIEWANSRCLPGPSYLI